MNRLAVPGPPSWGLGPPGTTRSGGRNGGNSRPAGPPAGGACLAQANGTMTEIRRLALTAACSLLLAAAALPACVLPADIDSDVPGSDQSATGQLISGVASASSVEKAGLEADKAVDGNVSTRWSSQFSDPQWLQIDFGSSKAIDQVTLVWETAFGADYQLQTSADGATFATVRTVTNSDGGTDSVTGLNAHGRFLRIFGTRRGTQWGYSLFEVQVNGGGGGGGGGGSGGSGG